MGPITIFDKSALQALNVDEAVWFDAFFFANVVPVFLVETLADLEKEVARGKTPEDVVGRLAEKTPTSASPNVHHRYLILAELVGHEVEMAAIRSIRALHHARLQGRPALLPRHPPRLHLGRTREQQGRYGLPLLPAFCDGIRLRRPAAPADGPGLAA